MNYVCFYDTHRVMLGPMESKEVVDYINSRNNPKAFCNMSRYLLAKEGIYPNTKEGDAKIALHLEEFKTKTRDGFEWCGKEHYTIETFACSCDTGDGSGPEPYCEECHGSGSVEDVCCDYHATDTNALASLTKE